MGTHRDWVELQVLMVRHGRTAVNAQGRLSGRHDPDLDELGRRQAEKLASAVAAIASGDVVVLSSPLQRCLTTAAAVARACGTDIASVQPDDRFIEVDYGDWDGRALADVPPEAWTRWRNDPEFSPPGGETLGSVSARVVDGLTDWSRRCPAGTLVVSSHVSPIKAAVIWALGVDEAATWRMRLDNASICRVTVLVDGEGVPRPSLRGFNETAHLQSLR